MLKKLAVIGAFAILTTGCKGAIGPVFTAVENKVLADIEAGDGLPQVEADVNALVPGLQSVEDLVQSIITVLIDTGALSPSALTRAQAYKITLMTITHR
jgi:hypothetical protein